MKNKFAPILVVVLLSLPLLTYGQAKTRKLPTSINHPSVNAFAPLVSADGNTLIFVSDNAEDNVLTPFFTTRENNDWIEPIMLPKSLHTRLNFLYGIGLSADGKKIFLSTIKTPSVGGFDIWTSELRGKVWTEPQNMGMPINSKMHEASASVTTDGNTLYFMRCQTMDQTKADNCKIFSVKKKSNGQWDEPIELPSNINTGNSQTPRIMADGETLIFSSNKITGSKGGMDLYVTRLRNGNWADPVPLDFVNTEKNDQYVSASALGRYLLKDTQGPRKNEIMEYLIPNELRPRGMMKLDGKVNSADGGVVSAYVAITDLSSNKKIFNGRPNTDGTFLLYLMEGSKYELSIDPELSGFSFYSRMFDLTTDKIPQSDKVDVTLKSVVKGDELSLDLVAFKAFSSELEKSSGSELQRLARIIKNDPLLKFEIQVMLNGYLEDSVKSSEDLTEIRYDSITVQVDEIDSLGQLFKKDTLLVKTTFHNDRTQKQATAVTDFLIGLGVNPASLSTFVNAIPATLPENRRIRVRARVR